MSLAQIGEFSFIIAGLGVAMGVTRHFLYAVAVAVSAVTTLATPWLVRAADPVAAYIDRKLPQPLQTFTALYGTWLERLRAGPATRRTGRIRRVVRLLVLDAAVLAALVFVVAIGLDEATAFLQNAIGLAPNAARVVVIGGGYALALPLIIGIGRLSRRLGSTLAIAALPRASGKVDLDAAPRRALVVTLQLAVALLAGVVVLVITQPVLPSYAGLLLLGALFLGFGVAIWRSAADLQSHVRAGAQAVAEALTAHARGGSDEPASRPITQIPNLLKGLGAPVAIELAETSPAVGRTLAQLNLRGRTGATVLAISRANSPIVIPTAGERLQAGDVLAIAGTEDALRAARAILLDGDQI